MSQVGATQRPRQNPSHIDYTNESGAAVIKANIEEFWRARGYDVQVMLVPGPFSNALRASRFDLRSDLVNGLPRGALERELKAPAEQPAAARPPRSGACSAEANSRSQAR